MGLAQQRGQHRDHQQHQQPGDVDRERRRQGDQRDRVLHRGEQQGEEPDPAHRLPPGALQLVVDLRVLELLQVERRGVPHQLDAGAVGEEIAQQALEQRREPGQPLAHQRDRELERQQLAEPRPVHRAAAARHADRAHHLVHDQLADPEHRERHERARDPQHQDAGDVARLACATPAASSRGTCRSACEPLAPAGLGLGGLPAPAVGPYYRMLEWQRHVRKLIAGDAADAPHRLAQPLGQPRPPRRARQRDAPGLARWRRSSGR